MNADRSTRMRVLSRAAHDEMFCRRDFALELHERIGLGGSGSMGVCAPADPNSAERGADRASGKDSYSRSLSEVSTRSYSYVVLFVRAASCKFAAFVTKPRAWKPEGVFCLFLAGANIASGVEPSRWATRATLIAKRRCRVNVAGSFVDSEARGACV